MTKLNLSSKKHIIIIISALILAVGMAVGTICHFLAGGFFRYGSEFTSYKSVTVNYLAAEQTEDDVREICSSAFNGISPFEISYATVTVGGEAVYKFSQKTDSAALEKAVEEINVKLAENSGLSVAALHEGNISAGGAKVLAMASIALASAAAFQLLYFIVRYHWKMALAALLADVHNLGIFISLLAITRLPVGIEAVALAALVILATMIASGIFFDRLRKNKRNEEYQKLQGAEIADISAAESVPVNVILFCMLACAIAVTCIFAVIPAFGISAVAPFAAALLAVISLLYGSLVFVPSVACWTVSAKRQTAKSVSVQGDK